MAHRKWKETKQLPGTAGPGNRLGSCLVSFHFLWAILCPQAVLPVRNSETLCHKESSLTKELVVLILSDMKCTSGIPEAKKSSF